MEAAAAAELCAGVLLSVVAWSRQRQSRDQQAEARRQQRRLQLRAARRLRLQRLREAWRQRERGRTQSRLHRLCAQDRWMEEAAHHFFRDPARRRPKVWSYPRTSDWWENTAATFTADQWLHHFGVSRETFSFLCMTLKSQLKRQDTTYRLCIPLQKRVALTLYKLANPCDYKTVADLFAVGVASVCRCVHEFCTAVIEVLKPQLVVTPDKSERANLSECFYHTYGISQCVGVLDSMHITIIKPPHYQPEQPDSESYLAILLQAVVDDKGLFWDLSMSSPTWTNDSSGQREVRTCEDFSSRMLNVCGTDSSSSSSFILGDAGYPSQRWLLKPCAATTGSWLTAERELFNTQISQARGVAQHAFERLKGRWRCLNKRNDCNVEIVKDMVETCCVLHNLCEKHKDPFLPEWRTTVEPILTVNGEPRRNSEADTVMALQ